MDKAIMVAKILFEEGQMTDGIVNLLRKNGYIVHDAVFGHVSDYCDYSGRCNEACYECERALSLEALRGEA